MSGWDGMDWSKAPSPAYVVDEAALERNLALLDDVQRRAGCKIIMALKGFSMFGAFPLIRRTLCGAAASSLNEARLARDSRGRPVILFPDEWNLRYFQERNPAVGLGDIPF